MNIILSGFMGSGKTTLSVLLASKLNMKYVDIDEYIQRKSGMSVQQIFELYGEKRFREIESEVCKELSALDNYIIATGGGTILNSENVRALKSSGKIVFLDVSVDTVLRRLHNDNSRPLLNTGDKEDAVTVLLEGRLPIYKSAADICFDANSDDTNEKCDRLIAKLGL